MFYGPAAAPAEVVVLEPAAVGLFSGGMEDGDGAGMDVGAAAAAVVPDPAVPTAIPAAFCAG